MIDNPIIRFIFSVSLALIGFSLFISILPVWDLPSVVSTGLVFLLDFLWSFDFIFPVVQFLLVFKAFLYFEFILASFFVAKWIYSYFISKT